MELMAVHVVAFNSNFPSNPQPFTSDGPSGRKENPSRTHKERGPEEQDLRGLF